MSVFLDTSVILAGLVDFGPQSAPAQQLMHAVAEKRVPSPATAWHCCLEFYSVATRLPPEFRLTPDDAWVLFNQSQGDAYNDADATLHVIASSGSAPPLSLSQANGPANSLAI